jgi:hypothetical protein
MVHIALNWNRAIIRDFIHNEIHFFYPAEKKSEFSTPIFNARFRNLVANALTRLSAVLIHGAGAIISDKTAVFLAPDEGGKSTAINLSTEEEILSDDHIVLQGEIGNVMVHSTPFGFKTCGPREAELGAFFLLEKADSLVCHRLNQMMFWNSSGMNKIPDGIPYQKS